MQAPRQDTKRRPAARTRHRKTPNLQAQNEQQQRQKAADLRERGLVSVQLGHLLVHFALAPRVELALVLGQLLGNRGYTARRTGTGDCSAQRSLSAGDPQRSGARMAAGGSRSGHTDAATTANHGNTSTAKASQRREPQSRQKHTSLLHGLRPGLVRSASSFAQSASESACGYTQPADTANDSHGGTQPDATATCSKRRHRGNADGKHNPAG